MDLVRKVPKVIGTRQVDSSRSTLECPGCADDGVGVRPGVDHEPARLLRVGDAADGAAAHDLTVWELKRGDHVEDAGPTERRVVDDLSDPLARGDSTKSSIPSPTPLAEPSPVP